MDMCYYLFICYAVSWSRFYDFFFFKQKTAYEIRISDWSSDVCSSDLVGCAVKAENRQRTNDIYAGRRFGDKDHRLLAMAVGALGIGLAHENDDFAARVGRASRVPFTPVYYIIIAISYDRTADIGRVPRDQTSVVSGKSVSVRVEPGGRRTMKK